MEVTEVRRRKTVDGCVPGRFSLCDMRAPGQGGVGLLYIAISLLFLLMTVIAEMGGGGGGGGGTGSWEM